jgi:hypothetical protein
LQGCGLLARGALLRDRLVSRRRLRLCSLLCALRSFV